MKFGDGHVGVEKRSEGSPGIWGASVLKYAWSFLDISILLERHLRVEVASLIQLRCLGPRKPRGPVLKATSDR